MTWILVGFAVIMLALIAYLILSIEWRDRQIKALILLSQGSHQRLDEIIDSMQEIANATVKIERHSARAVKAEYDRDQWERENP